MSSMRMSRRGALLASAAAPAAILLGCDPQPRSAPPRAALRLREVLQIVAAQATSDGAGVKLARSLGSQGLPMLDPFLMLDEFRTDRPGDYLAGFPDHPHRGFETVTYMLDGAMEHRDSLGNHGRLAGGSVQWMTAGRGIVHSEMPKQVSGLMWGFQLWVNLPAARKMTAPRYQDIEPSRIPLVEAGEARVRLVAGELGGARGPVEGIVTAPEMLDVTVPARGRFVRPLPPGHNAFVYVIDGAALVGPGQARVGRGELAVLGPGEGASATSAEGARFLLLAGRPIGEPVARYGPFVMNTDQELRQAFDDYRSGRLVQPG